MGDRDRGEASVFRLGRYRWLLSAIGFTVAFCLFVAAAVFVLYSVVEHGRHVIASERTRGLFAIVLFASLIAIPTYLLVVLERDRE